VLSSPSGIGWQGAGTISDDTLANGTTILSQVKAIQAADGDVTISFGGAAGQEAALTAMTAANLQAGYQSVIDRYHVHSLDFDIEGAAVADQRSILRDQALVGLKAANPGLNISFTLPVLPTGLTADGINVLASAKHDGLNVDLVNIMTMDYGASVDNGGAMGVDAINATIATEKQLASLGLSSKIGITPMIGVNDIASEVFTLADAQTLVNYAQLDANVARLSMWSVARDNGNSAGASYASPDSSGIAQQPTPSPRSSISSITRGELCSAEVESRAANWVFTLPLVGRVGAKRRGGGSGCGTRLAPQRRPPPPTPPHKGEGITPSARRDHASRHE